MLGPWQRAAAEPAIAAGGFHLVLDEHNAALPASRPMNNTLAGTFPLTAQHERKSNTKGAFRWRQRAKPHNGLSLARREGLLSPAKRDFRR